MSDQRRRPSPATSGKRSWLPGDGSAPKVWGEEIGTLAPAAASGTMLRSHTATTSRARLPVTVIEGKTGESPVERKLPRPRGGGVRYAST